VREKTCRESKYRVRTRMWWKTNAGSGTVKFGRRLQSGVYCAALSQEHEKYHFQPISKSQLPPFNEACHEVQYNSGPQSLSFERLSTQPNDQNLSGRRPHDSAMAVYPHVPCATRFHHYLPEAHLMLRSAIPKLAASRASLRRR
jgi:hypothetical protein